MKIEIAIVNDRDMVVRQDVVNYMYGTMIADFHETPIYLKTDEDDKSHYLIGYQLTPIIKKAVREPK
jgi:hypothetical protein